MKSLRLTAVAFFVLMSAFSDAHAENIPSWKEAKAYTWIITPQKRWESGNKECWLFQNYSVIRLGTSESVDSDVHVFKLNKNSKFPQSCDEAVGKALISLREAPYGDVAISENSLFLDSGTGSHRGLTIIKLDTKAEIVNTAGYPESIKLVGNELEYIGELREDESERKDWPKFEPCNWRPEHKPRGHFQDTYRAVIRFDLKTGKRTVRQIKCTVEGAHD